MDQLKIYTVEQLRTISQLESDPEMVERIIGLRKTLHKFLKLPPQLQRSMSEEQSAFLGFGSSNSSQSLLLIKYVDDQFRNFISDKKLELNIVKSFHQFIQKTSSCSDSEIRAFFE